MSGGGGQTMVMVKYWNHKSQSIRIRRRRNHQRDTNKSNGVCDEFTLSVEGWFIGVAGAEQGAETDINIWKYCSGSCFKVGRNYAVVCGLVGSRKG